MAKCAEESLRPYFPPDTQFKAQICEDDMRAAELIVVIPSLGFVGKLSKVPDAK